MMTRGTTSAEELGSKKIKLPNEEDRISDLPDSIVHHILSFLPSIREAIQTGVLSKRWRNQWTALPVLNFNLLGMNEEHTSRFIFSTLVQHGCSKIRKLTILKGTGDDDEYLHLTKSIDFAVTKEVEELILELRQGEFKLPECIFNHSSLVTLEACSCNLEPNGKVRWGNLKELHLRFCSLSDQAVDSILSGSPVLESLVLDGYLEFEQLVIASKYLKKLELGVGISVLEISCPNLEELNLVGEFGADTIRLSNLTSLTHAMLDFECDESFSKEIFQHLQHVKDIKLGDSFIEFLSSLEMRGAQSFPLLNNKCLTLDYARFDKQAAGIAHALHNSPLIEKLVITKFSLMYAAFPVNVANYWYSNETVFKCLESNLKIVEIINFSKRVRDYWHVLNFIDFLLKNARVLEKLVMVFENDKDFEFEVSMKFWCFKKCPQHVTVEFLHSASSPILM